MPNKQLTPHFNLSEFRCPCCNDAIATAAQKLAEALEPVREEYGPLHIWSGFRCPKQNHKLKGALFSQHLVGLAADLACSSDADRFELITALLRHGFKRIGIGAKIIHADIGTPTGPLIWTYYRPMQDAKSARRATRQPGHVGPGTRARRSQTSYQAKPNNPQNQQSRRSRIPTS